MLTRIVPAPAMMVAVSALMVTAQTKPGSALFTPEQSAAGQSAYQANCSTCHGPELPAATRRLNWRETISSAPGVTAPLAI